MNLGVQFLREHMIDAARIHYAITDAGGFSPNVVQPTAQVLYMVRSPKCSQAFELLERVEDIAKGAALMTGTSVKRRFIDGTSDVIPNTTLEKVLYENYKEIGVPGYTEEEKAFAAALIATYENPRASLPGSASNYDPDIAAFVREKIKDGRPLNDFLIPHVTSEHCRMGSTDVGDVSWICPTAQIGAVTWASNSPGHSWQNVACGCTSIAHKGLINAGRVMAGAVIDLIDDPSVIDAAKVEFKKRLGGETYKCPIPADVKPTPISEPM